MKPIKFRGLTKDGEWVKGWYCKVEGKHYIILDDAKIVTSLYGPRFNNVIKGFNEVIPDTVSQYTGFKDTKKTEIYKHDLILSFDGTMYVVHWDIENGQWWGIVRNGGKKKFSRPLTEILAKGYTEVIGNIHQNKT